MASFFWGGGLFQINLVNYHFQYEIICIARRFHDKKALFLLRHIQSDAYALYHWDNIVSHNGSFLFLGLRIALTKAFSFDLSPCRLKRHTFDTLM